MTLHLIDIASYQRGIDLGKVKAAGFSIANVKTSQGVGYTFGDAFKYATGAAARGMGVSCFHWLDNSASGSAQADYCWRTLGPIVKAVGPVALQVDNEDAKKPATWAITRDFVHAIADRLGYLPFMYTGDWWATAGGRAGWDVHSLTPWLMAAPNRGYVGTYPGDQSADWRAGYWGYSNLALMQYAVSPIDGAGGGNLSKTAIRDPQIWAALTGGAVPAPSTPATTTGDDDDMHTLMRYEHDPAVFYTDGKVARWVKTPEEIADIGTLGLIKRVSLATGEPTPADDIMVVGRRELIGVIVGPCPRGWEAQAQQPGAPTVSDAQLDVLAGKVATKLSALRFVPTV